MRDGELKIFGGGRRFLVDISKFKFDLSSNAADLRKKITFSDGVPIETLIGHFKFWTQRLSTYAFLEQRWIVHPGFAFVSVRRHFA